MKSGRFVNLFQAVAPGLCKVGESKERENKMKQTKTPGILPLCGSSIFVSEGTLAVSFMPAFYRRTNQVLERISFSPNLRAK